MWPILQSFRKNNMKKIEEEEELLSKSTKFAVTLSVLRRVKRPPILLPGCDSKVVEKTKGKRERGPAMGEEGKGILMKTGVSWKWRLGEIPRK